MDTKKMREDLEKLRKQWLLSHTEMAKKMEIHWNTYRNFLYDNCSYKTLRLIKDFLDSYEETNASEE